MTEYSPRGGGGDPRFADPEAEIPSFGQISGHEVDVAYEGGVIYISWSPDEQIYLKPSNMGLSAWVITESRSESIIWLRLKIDAGYGWVHILLPFRAGQFRDLRAFAQALTIRFPAAGLVRAEAGAVADSAGRPHDAADHGPPPADAVVADRGRAGGGRREPQVLPVVTIKRPPAQWTDDDDWISLRPPAETEAMLQSAYQEPTQPEHSPRR
jgi:hypothetical protein